MKNGTKEKSLSNRSIGYPTISLEDCIRVIEQAAASGRRLTIEQLAAFRISQRGRMPQNSVSSVNSGAFLARKAALKDFGLIDSSKGGIYITDVAMSIVAAQSGDQKIQAIRMAFLTPVLFKAIFDELPKNIPIHKIDNLGNKAVSSGVVLKNRSNFVKSFVDSGIYSGLIIEEGPDAIILTLDDQSKKEDNSIDKVQESVETSMLELPFPGGIRLIIPSNEAVSIALVEGKLSKVSEEIKHFAAVILGHK